MDKERYMERAIELAGKGWGWTSPNPMVGAVVVANKKIIGEGYHEKVGGPHAEVNALYEAGAEARGASLFVSLEPCVNRGRTPPCVDAIKEAEIKEVIIGAKDPNPKVNGKGAEVLQAAGIAVKSGVLEDKAAARNEIYNKHMKTGRPFVLVKVAMSIDGKIAAKKNESSLITGERARQHVHVLRAGYDAILTGIGTIRVDDPRLTARLENNKARQPTRIILDSYGVIEKRSKVIKSAKEIPTIIVSSNKLNEEKRSELTEAGAEVMIIDAEDGKIDIEALFKKLGERGITSIMVEAGKEVASDLIDKDLFDKMAVFIAPKLIGGKDSLPFYEGVGRKIKGGQTKLLISEVSLHGDDVLIEVYPTREHENL